MVRILVVNLVCWVAGIVVLAPISQHIILNAREVVKEEQIVLLDLRVDDIDSKPDIGNLGQLD